MRCRLSQLTAAAAAIVLVLLTHLTIANAGNDNIWAAVSLTDCNATCTAGNGSSSEGVQRVNFGCYLANSTGVRRLPGTRFYLATTDVGQVPSGNCAGTQAGADFVRCRRVGGGGCRLRPAEDPYHWQLDVAAAASLTTSAACQLTATVGDTAASGCGQPGFVRLGFSCRSRRQGANTAAADAAAAAVSEARCLAAAGLPRPEPLAVPCRRLLECRPVWKAGPWGACSRNCGLGETARTVECSQLSDSTEGPVYAPVPGRCGADSEGRPHSREYCVVRPECPPYYRLRPGKCLPTFSTVGASQSRRWCNETGFRPTNAECVQLVSDAAAGLNETRPRPTADCRRQPRPPPFQRCRVDAETLGQRGIACVEPDAAELLAPPRLLPAAPGSLLVQTERLPSLEATCGQSVTLIPGTRLRLHCGVTNYKAADLRWRKLGRKRDFRSSAAGKWRRFGGQRRGGRGGGGAKGCGRICVSRNGDLLFQRFKPRDAGTYEVTAGAAKATVHLTWHTAYAAFLGAYLPRAHLLRRQSAASLPSSSAASATGAAAGGEQQQPTQLVRDAPSGWGGDTLAWMTGAWSDCPCGGGGGGGRQRRRMVRCEGLRSSTYSVVEAGRCERLLGPAPPAVEECDPPGGKRRSCPDWRVGDWDDRCPTSRCYIQGISLTLRSVVCHDESRNATLPDTKCHLAPKPDTARQCRNPACLPEWSVGAWSACSISCGAFGFRSRRVQCLWRDTGLPAGLACEHLPLPKGYKSCYEGPCYQLGCVDLSPVCKIYQASALCAHPSLRKSCCATCNTYQLEVYKDLRMTRS